QMPLHVWLPDSMEGPTPISALIHAATMVTAGVFLVARMSPLFEHAEAALTLVLVIGGLTALLTGFLGIVQMDIKRVIAYSTLSQLGYMMVAQGASAYAAGIYHLMTHAFFKALLFLAAGSVIVALHHEQDIRRMGGLRKYMPVTYWTALAGSLALIGFPGFAGFFSKDALIEAVHLAETPGAGFAYACVLAGVFVTALYSFRMFFLVFHGPERISDDARAHLHESPAVITVPLILLAIPAVLVGWWATGPLLFGDYFGDSLFVQAGHDGLAELGREWHGPLAFVLHGLASPVLYLALAGAGTAWFFYLHRPALAERWRERAGWLYDFLVNKYYFDWLAERVIPGGGRGVGQLLWRVGDAGLIDGLAVNGSARLIGWVAAVARRIQRGYLYDYAFAMLLGLLAILTWFSFA
ncbi:MAG: NADH-quinone oxidoreductase subunit L, partial [Gammaproteobacteria bacterium]